MNGPIQNAADMRLNQNPGTLPNMADALTDWFQPLVFSKIVKTVVNAQVVETPTVFNTFGVRQPMGPQALNMKPEGERQWKWETVHTYPTVALSPDDIVNFAGQNYRVMKKTDYGQYGYIVYEICQDYQR